MAATTKTYSRHTVTVAAPSDTAAVTAARAQASIFDHVRVVDIISVEVIGLSGLYSYTYRVTMTVAR